MSLEKIIAVSGKPGLFKLLAQTRGGFLAESLLDSKRQSISMRNNVSVLNEIAIYTYDEEIPLREIFKTIFDKEEGKATIGHKSSKGELEKFFREILPEYDEDRVYASDIKKVVQWYNLLEKASLLEEAIKEEEENTTSAETTNEEE